MQQESDAEVPRVIRMIRPLSFDDALKAADAAWRLGHAVALRTVLVRDSEQEDSLVERYEVAFLDSSPLVDGESDDTTWGPDRPFGMEFG